MKSPASSACICLLLIAALLFQTGCATTADGRKTQAQGTAIGAVGGAILGGLLGAATGNRDNIARFAIAGAAAGGAAGFAYGTAVAKRKAQYVKAEDWLDAEIGLARQANKRAYAYNTSLRRRVAALETRIAAARRAGNRTALRTAKAEITQIRNEATRQGNSEAQTARDAKVVLGDAKARTAANYSAFRTEANNLDKAQAERGQLLGRLATLNNSLDR